MEEAMSMNAVAASLITGGSAAKGISAVVMPRVS